jgi:serine O-acetyltransferase
VIDPKTKKSESDRKKIAEKIGFDAYGTSTDMTDPVAKAINHMLDHMQVLDGQIDAMKKALKEAGVSCPEQPIPEEDYQRDKLDEI